jgi:hypothetical protein
MSIKDFSTEDLINELANRGYVRVLWNDEDIRMQANELDVDLTDEQVGDVTKLLEESFDASVGLSWGEIEGAIRHVTGM